MSAVTLLYSRGFCYCFLLPIGRLSGARRVASGSGCLLFGFGVVAGAHFAFCPCPVRVSWTGAGCIRAAPAADLMVDSVLAPARCVCSGIYFRMRIFLSVGRRSRLWTGLIGLAVRGLVHGCGLQSVLRLGRACGRGTGSRSLIATCNSSPWLVHCVGGSMK